MRDTQREAETQVEGEAGSMQGTRRGTWSRVSGITSWAEGSVKPLSHLGCPSFFLFKDFIYFRETAWARGAEGERDSQADSTPSAEPDRGLDPTTLRSWPEPKPRVRCSTDCHPGAPFPASEATHMSWFVTPSSIFSASNGESSASHRLFCFPSLWTHLIRLEPLE